jgi:raffinose/stachyose/melibiose transport system permease protein
MNWKDFTLLQKITASLLLGAFGAAALIPFLYLASLSLAEFQDTFRIFFWPVNFRFDNFPKAWQAIGSGNYFFNSIWVAFMSVALSIFLGAPAAYAFARFDFRGSGLVYNLFLLSLTLPTQALVVPLFINLKELRLLNNTFALGLVYPALGLAFAIFILRGFFETLPGELADAAVIDGCTPLQCFWKVMLPLPRPAIASVATFQFIWSWDEFLMAFTFINDDLKMTLPAGIARLHGEYFTDYPVLGAALVLSSIPVILFYLSAQRQFIKGITAGAFK